MGGEGGDFIMLLSCGQGVCSFFFFSLNLFGY